MPLALAGAPLDPQNLWLEHRGVPWGDPRGSTRAIDAALAGIEARHQRSQVTLLEEGGEARYLAT